MEICLQGIPLSGGIAIGTLHVLHRDEEWVVPEYDIPLDMLAQELDRYRRALTKSIEELQELRQLFQEEAAAILEAQIHMLNDPMLTEEVERRIQECKKNGESVFKEFIREYLTYLPEPERRLDVKDVASRLLRNLYPQEDAVAVQSIVGSYELLPSHTAKASLGEVQAFITELGGNTSHTALIAKARAIPYVSNIQMEMLQARGGGLIIVDGHEGKVILHPEEKTVAHYREKQRGQSVAFSGVHEEGGEVYTVDGTRVEVQANVDNIQDLDLLKRANIAKIGLLRSEFLPFRKELEAVTEEEQYQLYRRLVQLAGSMEIVFRFFDIGSDKKLITHKHEPNPALGERSIRFLLKHKKLFATQIRAILRAATAGTVHLLLPLITDKQELLEAKERIWQEWHELQKEGIAVPKTLSIGCMVEVPAFVLMCDEMECDFLSIGTNDLAQYTLAIDRTNPVTSNRYGEAHPSVLRMIKHVLSVAKVPVSLCGEMAANPKYTQMLLEMGVRTFSCAPRSIAPLKAKIRSISLDSV